MAAWLSLYCKGCNDNAGVAVLEAIEEDGLQQHAHEVGTYLIQQLESLQQVRSSFLTLFLKAMEMPLACCLHHLLVIETSTRFMH